MTFRRLVLLLTALNTAVAGIAAHGSYVVEADSAVINTDAIAAGADFDFVTHDFGIESADAIQITLTNLSRATNLHGNLLLWSFKAADKSSAASADPSADSDESSPDDGDPLPDSADPDGLPSAVETAATERVTTDSSEDYSYYDEGIADSGQIANGLSDVAVHSENDGLPVSSGEPLPASVQNLPAIDTNGVFWILKPAEFTSFSQMTAARFGF